MKKLLLFTLVAFLLAVPANAKKPQLARSVWFLFEKVDNMEKQPNDSVVVSYKTKTGKNMPNNSQLVSDPKPIVIMTVQNKTERAVYVDLQQSFIIINGELYPLYIPISEVQTTSNTSITGVNFGLVGLGSASTTSNATITHAERYIIIPGETKKTMEIPLSKWEASFHLNNVDAWFQFKSGNGVTDINRSDYVSSNHELFQYFINYGEVRNYDYDDNPLTLDMRICYSFNDSMTPNFTSRSVFYTSHIVGSDYLKGFNVDDNLAKERALKIYPPLNDYLNSSNSFYFHIWTSVFLKHKK